MLKWMRREVGINRESWTDGKTDRDTTKLQDRSGIQVNH
jgi:hypothetical protein